MIGFSKVSSLKTFATVAIVVGGFVGLIAWGEYSSWKSEVANTEADLVQTARAVVQHMDDTVEMAKLPLASIATLIQENADAPDLADKARRAMRHQIDATPWLDRLTFINENGKVVATSANVDTSNLNFADRDYFKFHKASITRQPVLGTPIRSRFAPEWILTISQRVNHADGGFAGIVNVALTISQISQFFDSFNVGKQGSFLMTRADGLVLARAPFREDILGTDMSSQALFTYLKTSQSGSYHYVSPIDAQPRIGGFFKSKATGIVVLAAVSEREALQNWINGARYRWLSCMAIVVVTGAFVWRWRRLVMLRRASEATLLAREAEFRLLAEGSGDLIQRFNGNGIREYLSPACREIFGVTPEAMIGTHILENLHEDDVETVNQVMDRLRAGSARENMVIRRKRADGRQVWLDTKLRRLPGGTTGADILIVAVTRDVTRQKKIQEELDTLANTDELTQLANRRSFNSRFDDMVRQAEQERRPLSLLMIDADKFKFFNDTYGHAAGDECLRSMAAIALSSIRRNKDLAARYGGEELAVLLPDTDIAGARRVAETIRQRVADSQMPHVRNVPWGNVTISIGTATFDPAEIGMVTAAGLFERADQALYQAKNAGRNRVASAEDEVSPVAAMEQTRSA